MSDVLVKGMDMPTACRHGECNFACSAAYQTGLICIVRKQYVVPGDVPGDCPCSLVSTHGDLIDRDALLKKCEFVCTDDDEDIRAVRYSIIENAPTVIPADESDMDSFIRIFEEDDEEDGMDSFIRILKD